MAELTVKSKFFAMEDKVEVSDEELAKKVAVKMEVSNITSLTNEQLDKLKAGDIVTKKTGNQLHTYVVSYKGEGANEGICLTYTASGYIETVSYDRTNDGWAYNSTDVCNIDNIPNVEEAPSGIIQDVLGLNSSGKLVKGSVGSEVIAYEGTSLLPTDVVFEDWTLHRAIKDGNILWITLCGAIKNNSASQVDLYREPLVKITLPSDISSKIYRQEGTTCNNAYTLDPTVLYWGGTKTNGTVPFGLLSSAVNELVLLINGSITISAGYNTRIDCRIPLFLDIGTVQN